MSADGPRSTIRLWDVHAHVIPPSILEAARKGRFGMSLADGRLIGPEGSLPLAFFPNPRAVIDWLDERGMYGAVISVPPALYRYDLQGREAREWVHLVNAGLEDVVSLAPSRLRALASTPADAEDAVRVLEQTHRPPWVGLSLGSMVGPLTLDDSALYPLYEAAHAVGRYVFIHPVDSRVDPRLDRYYLGNLLGNPVETSLAAACLIFSGLLDRFNGVRFGLAHAGGALPFLIGRWQRGYDTSRPGVPRVATPPLEAAKRLWYDSIAFTEEARRLLLDVVGPDQILLGSDFPFPMRDPDPVASVTAMGERALRTIGETNPVRVLGLSEER